MLWGSSFPGETHLSQVRTWSRLSERAAPNTGRISEFHMHSVGNAGCCRKKEQQKCCSAPFCYWWSCQVSQAGPTGHLWLLSVLAPELRALHRAVIKQFAATIQLVTVNEHYRAPAQLRESQLFTPATDLSPGSWFALSAVSWNAGKPLISVGTFPAPIQTAGVKNHHSSW